MLKEIKQNPTNSVWEFDRRFKILLDHMSFGIAQQHKVWFIVALLPHIRFPLSQQKIETQVVALELVMKLEASMIGDTSASMKKI